MNPLKKSPGCGKQAVILNMNSRNKSALNKIRKCCNTNVNKIKKNINNMIKSKNRGFSNFKSNRSLSNKPSDQNNKQSLSNKLVSHVFSYRKIDKVAYKNLINNNSKLSNCYKNIHKYDTQKILEGSDNGNNPNNNVTNNITNNITNIFFNNDNKNRKNEVNSYNHINTINHQNNKNNFSSNSNYNANKISTKRNSMKNLKDASIFNRNKFRSNYNNINKVNMTTTTITNNSKFNKNFISQFQIINANSTINGNLNTSSTRTINNNQNSNNGIYNNTMYNYSNKIKNDKKKKSKPNKIKPNSKKYNLKINEINNIFNNLDFIHNIVNKDKMPNKFKKYDNTLTTTSNINSNVNTNSGYDKKSIDKFKGYIHPAKKFPQCLKRNQTEKGFSNKDNSTSKERSGKNFFSKNMQEINAVYSNRQKTDYNMNNFTIKNLLSSDSNKRSINNLNALAKGMISMHSMAKISNSKILNNNSSILSPSNKLNKKDLNINFSSTMISKEKKAKSKQKSKSKEKCIYSNINNKLKNNSMIKNNNISNGEKINSYNNRNYRIHSHKNNKKMVHCLRTGNDINNSNINNVLNNMSLHAQEKDFFEKIMKNQKIKTNNNYNKNSNSSKTNGIIFNPFHNLKRFAFNFESREKDYKNDNEKFKFIEYYNNQTRLHNKKIIIKRKYNRCKNEHLKFDNKNYFVNSMHKKKEPNKSNNNINIFKIQVSTSSQNSVSTNEKKNTTNDKISPKKNLKHKIQNNSNVNQVISEKISPIKIEDENQEKKENNEILEKINESIHKTIKLNNSKDKNIIEDSINIKVKISPKELSKSVKKIIENENSKEKSKEIEDLSEEEIDFLGINISSSGKIINPKSLTSNDKETHSNKIKSCNFAKELNLKHLKLESSNNNLLDVEKKETDPQYANEYIEEILESLLCEEESYIKEKYIDPHYLENIDSEITPEMRTVAVDWLVLIHYKIFKFKENTLFLAIQIFDRYLSKMILSTEKTELLLLTSFTLASKLEEVDYVNMQETLQLAQNKFSKEQVINMEYEILTKIKFRVLAPTMCDYFKLFSSFLNFNSNKIYKGFYLLNIILVDFHMLEYPNCILALAVIKIITKKLDSDLIKLIKKITKENDLESYDGYLAIGKINSICQKIKLLYDTFIETKYKNIPEKFAESQYNYISSFMSI